MKLSEQKRKELLAKIDAMRESNPDKFEFEMYWDYQDEFPIEILDEDKPIQEIEDDFNQIVWDYNWEHIERGQLEIAGNIIDELKDDIQDLCETEQKEIIEAFVKEHSSKTITTQDATEMINRYKCAVNDNQETVESHVRDNISLNENMNDLAKNFCVNLNLFFLEDGDDIDTEATKFGHTVTALADLLESRDVFNDDKEIRLAQKQVKESKMLAKLFESQGYEISDLSRETKVKNSKFLKSFLYELENICGDKLLLTACIKTSLYDYLYSMRGENQRGKADEVVFIDQPNDRNGFDPMFLGFFNPENGDYSEMYIQLEKPFSHSMGKAIIHIDDGTRETGYSVSEVVGTPDWNETFTIYQNVTPLLDTVLEKDRSSAKGSKYHGKTLGDFLEEKRLNPEETTVQELNQLLFDNGVRTI